MANFMIIFQGPYGKHEFRQGKCLTTNQNELAIHLLYGKVVQDGM